MIQKHYDVLRLTFCPLFLSKVYSSVYQPRHEKTCLWFCDQVICKPACSATETSQSLEIFGFSKYAEVLYEPPRDKTNKMTVHPAKTQINLGIRPIWSESSLCAQWIAKDPSFFHADSEDSDQTGWMPRLIWVFAWRTTTLLVLSWGGSYYLGSEHEQQRCWSDCAHAQADLRLRCSHMTLTLFLMTWLI